MAKTSGSWRILGLLGVSASMAGCAANSKFPAGATPQVEVAPPPRSEAWRSIATPSDADRLDRLKLAWTEALGEAKKSNAGDVRKEGKLLLPGAALPHPVLTPGSYKCRMLALGKAMAKARPFQSFKPFFCYVEFNGGQLTLFKQTGSQRPAGRFWEDDDSTRMIFLGSLILGNEEQPTPYGENPKRDMAGVLERIGPFRWRLIIPWPQAEAKLQVFELTPVDFALQPQ